MKHIIIFLFISLGLTLTISAEEGLSFHRTISPVDSKAIIESNKNNSEFKIIDVRTPREFNAGHLENSTMIDFYSNDFKQQMNKLDTDQTYLIYCRSGARSGRTLQLMEELGFKKVYNMSGGILGWNAEKLPTIK